MYHSKELVNNLSYDYTVVWKIFVWNYFVVRNIREKNFRAFPVPTKIF